MAQPAVVSSKGCMPDLSEKLSISRLEAVILFIASALVPLSSLRLAGVNLTYFDVAVGTLFLVQISRRGRIPALNLFYWASAVMLVAGAASGIGAVRPDLTLGQLVQWSFICFVVVPAIFQVARDPRSAQIVVAGVGLGCAYLVGYSLFDVFTGQGVYITGRYQGFHNSSQLLAFSVSSFLAYVFVAPAVLRGKSRLLVAGVSITAGLLTVLLAWLIFMTASRSGMIAGMLAPIVAVVLSQRTGHKLDLDSAMRKAVRISFVLVIFACTVLAMLSFASPEALAVVERRIMLSLDPSSTVISGRTKVYSEALASIDSDAVLRGVGLENYPFNSAHRQRPHNVMLIFLWEGGILFLAAFLTIVSIFVWRISLSRRRWAALQPTHRYVAAAAAAGFCAFLVIAMFNTQNIHRMYWFNYAYALGALACYRGRL